MSVLGWIFDTSCFNCRHFGLNTVFIYISKINICPIQRQNKNVRPQLLLSRSQRIIYQNMTQCQWCILLKQFAKCLCSIKTRPGALHVFTKEQTIFDLIWSHMTPSAPDSWLIQIRVAPHSLYNMHVIYKQTFLPIFWKAAKTWLPQATCQCIYKEQKVYIFISPKCNVHIIKLICIEKSGGVKFNRPARGVMILHPDSSNTEYGVYLSAYAGRDMSYMSEHLK